MTRLKKQKFSKQFARTMVTVVNAKTGECHTASWGSIFAAMRRVVGIVGIHEVARAIPLSAHGIRRTLSRKNVGLAPMKHLALIFDCLGLALQFEDELARDSKACRSNTSEQPVS